MRVRGAIRVGCAAFLFLAGCGIPTDPPAQPPFRAAFQAAVPSPMITLVWNPGGYSNFVILGTTDTSQPVSNWYTVAITTQTNFQVPATKPCEFFAMYGTNAVTGDSDWATR